MAFQSLDVTKISTNDERSLPPPEGRLFFLLIQQIFIDPLLPGTQGTKINVVQFPCAAQDK